MLDGVCLRDTGSGELRFHTLPAPTQADRNQVERLLRYTARPPIATERLELLPDGRVYYALKRTWSDGTAAVTMDPLSFIGRLCALIPPPRCHLIRYAGVLAAHSKHRVEVVPGYAPPPVEQPVAEQLPLFESSVLLRPLAQSQQEPSKPPHPSGHAWALLMQHVFAKDVLQCEHCQGRPRVIEVAKMQEAIARVLAHAGLGPRPPPRPRRAPPPQLSLPHV